MSEEQKSFLNNIFSEGEKKGCKATAENALAKMRMQFMPKDYLPVSTIRSYFSRGAKKVCSGEINMLESENKLVEDDKGMVEDCGDDNDEIDEYLQFNEQQERERSAAVQS